MKIWTMANNEPLATSKFTLRMPYLFWFLIQLIIMDIIESPESQEEIIGDDDLKFQVTD